MTSLLGTKHADTLRLMEVILMCLQQQTYVLMCMSDPQGAPPPSSVSVCNKEAHCCVSALLGPSRLACLSALFWEFLDSAGT